jgi:hypothetical protein
MRRLRKEISHGGTVPRGWRLAWYEPRRRVGVYFPTPLHRIARLFFEFLYRLRLALRAPRLERAEFMAIQRTYNDQQRMAEEYSRGYMAGWRECYQACIDAIEGEMDRADEVWDLGALLSDGTDTRPQN